MVRLGQMTLMLTDEAEMLLRKHNLRKGDMGKHVSDLIVKGDKT